MKDWWKKRKDEKAAKKQAKADAKPERDAAKQLKSTGVLTEPLLNGAPQSLGNDSANRVYKTENKATQPFGNGETTGYFKPNQGMAPAKNAVAASRVARGLGMDDIIPETNFAQIDTGKGVEMGAISANARGEALHKNVFDTDVSDQVKAQRKKEGRSEDLSDFKGTDFKKPKQVKNEETGEIEHKVMELTGTEMNDMDLSRPNTQQGLNKLQWFDALVGNMDRHGANIVVDPTTGNVSGIDNDLSFEKGAQARWGDAFTDGDNHFLGLPDMIDKDTAKRLLALNDAKIKQLLQTDNKATGLGKKAEMTDKAVTETIARLKIIQAKIRAIKADKTGGNLVKKWDDTTYQKQLNAPKRQNHKGTLEPNYLARHATFVNDAKDTSKGQYWRKDHRDEDAPRQPQADNTPKDVDDLKQVPEMKPEAEGAEFESPEVESLGNELKVLDVDPPEGDKGSVDKDLPVNELKALDVDAPDSDKGPSEKSLDGDEADEDEKQEVDKLVGEPVSANEGLALLDELLAELEQAAVQADEQKQQADDGAKLAGPNDQKPPVGDDEKLGAPTGQKPGAAIPTRPPVPNRANDDEKIPQPEDSDEERKKRFRDARSKFAGV